MAHWKGYHYLVLYEATADRVILGDPALGLVKMKRPQFEAAWTGRLLLLTPTPRLTAAEPETATVRRFWPFLAPFRGLVLEIASPPLIIQLLQLATPVFTQTIVDRVLVHQNVSMLNVLLVGMLIVSGFQVGTILLRSYLLIHVSKQLSLSLTADLFRQILPCRWAISSRASSATPCRGLPTTRRCKACSPAGHHHGARSRHAADGTEPDAVLQPPPDPGGVVPFPFYVGLTLLFTPLLKRHNQHTFEKAAVVQSTLVESIKAISAIKNSTAEVPTRWKCENQLVQVTNQQFHGNRLGMLLSGLSSTVNILASTFLLWYGATWSSDAS